MSGGKFYYPNGSGMYYEYEGFMRKYQNKTFIENLGEYTYDANNSETKEEDEDYNSGLVKNKKKRVIIYTLQN